MEVSQPSLLSCVLCIIGMFSPTKCVSFKYLVASYVQWTGADGFVSVVAFEETMTWYSATNSVRAAVDRSVIVKSVQFAYSSYSVLLIRSTINTL